MREDTYENLKRSWIALIQKLHQATTKENANLQCASLCTARCCPQARSRHDPNYAVGHVAIMLPFELEYLCEQTDTSMEQFEIANIKYSEDFNLSIGYITNKNPCPFLTHDYKCGVHSIRPLDCRSFPLIPVFQRDGDIAYRTDSDCPSVEFLAKNYQDLLKKIWSELLEHLPMEYRMLYNEL